jgi:hypothetical protein
MRIPLTLALSLCASAVAAQDWALRDGDRLLDRAEVQAFAEGQTLLFHDGGKSKYSHGGAYSYTYASGESAFGSFRIEADGTVCIAYRNGAARCDRYVASGERFVLLTQHGERFPVKSASGKE